MNKWINIEDMRHWLRDYATTEGGNIWAERLCLNLYHTCDDYIYHQQVGDGEYVSRFAHAKFVDDLEELVIAEEYVNILSKMLCSKDRLLMFKFSENQNERNK